MKRYQILLFGILLLFSESLFSQKSSLSGYVRDEGTGEALIGATVAAPELKTGTSTNTYGYFSLSLPAVGDSVTLVFAYIGYQTLAVRMRVVANPVQLKINLLPDGNQLEEVVIKAHSDNENVQRTAMSVINLPVSQIKAIPVIAGERDVLKAVQFLPGVSAGSEGTTGFYVRGGNIDQNLVLLDEAVVYNPNHLFGLVSTFNVNALNSVNLIKGGFPAQYGGRLSSVLDVTMREGNKNKFSGEGGIGIISSNLTLEGPIQKGKSSFIVSGRRSYLDLFLIPFNKGGNKTDYKLYDLNIKVNYELGKNDHLFASFFKGNDKAQYTGANALNYGIGFGNSTGTLRWNHLFGDKVFVNTSVISNQYHLGLNTTQGKYYALLYSEIRDYTAKTMLEWYPNSRHSVKVGAQYSQHALAPASVSAQIPKKGSRLQIKPDSIARTYANESAFFLNDEIHLGGRFGANVGLRVPVFTSKSKTYSAVEPRLTLKYSVNATTSIKAAYTEMNQFLHLVPSSTASLPTDIWIQSSPVVKPQTSRQVALGVFHNFAHNEYEASIEGYYKDMKHQVLFKEGTQIVLSSDLEKQLTFGSGDSYGVELFMRKNTGKLTGWVSYTWSKTTQTFPDLNFGQPFPFTYDRRHNLSVVGIYELNKKWSFSADFVFNTGSAYTLATGRVPVFNDGTLYDGIYYDFTSRNNYRLGNYHRLDVSASRHKTKTWWQHKVETEWVFGAYNLYSRRNPYFVYLTTDPATRQPLAKQVSLLPIIPSVSWNFKF
ncbi:MAG: TonB-dependent receptor [Saprospiraceae bacterium]|nr:TonB-dependent receptor [Saprospiraceae bacterium]